MTQREEMNSRRDGEDEPNEPEFRVAVGVRPDTTVEDWIPKHNNLHCLAWSNGNVVC